MGGNGDQVSTQSLGGEGDLQEALDCVGVEDGVGTQLVGQLSHLSDGHHGACFVVHHHNGHQNGVGPQCGFQGIQGDAALAVRLEIGNLEALAFQLMHAVEDGVVLDGSGDDVLVLLSEALCSGENGPVVRFRAAGGEENAVRFSAQGGGDLVPCLPKKFGGIEAEAV